MNSGQDAPRGTARGRGAQSRRRGIAMPGAGLYDKLKNGLNYN